MSERVLLVVLLAALPFLAACSTRRTLRIESDPPGATVWVNGERQAGTTPVDVPFVHYQTFEIRIEKEGHLPFSGAVPVRGGIDGYPVVDLPSELSVRHRGFTRRFTLEPLPRRPDETGVEAILDEARAFRDEARREAERGTSRGAAPRRGAGR